MAIDTNWWTRYKALMVKPLPYPEVFIAVGIALMLAFVGMVGQREASPVESIEFMP